MNKLFCTLGLHKMNPVKTFMQNAECGNSVDGHMCSHCGKRELKFLHWSKRGYAIEKQNAFNWVNEKSDEKKVITFAEKVRLHNVGP